MNNNEELSHLHPQSDSLADYSTKNPPAAIHIKKEYDDSCLILDDIKKTICEINSCEQGLSEFNLIHDAKVALLCNLEMELETWNISRKRVQNNIDQLKKQYDLVVIDEKQKQKEYTSIITNYENMIQTQKEINLSRPLIKKRNALWNQLDGSKIQLALLRKRITDLDRQKNQLNGIQRSRLNIAVVNIVDTFLKKKAEYQKKLLLDHLKEEELQFEKIIELQQNRNSAALKTESLSNQIYSKKTLNIFNISLSSAKISSEKFENFQKTTFKKSTISALKSPSTLPWRNSSPKMIGFTKNSPRMSPQCSSSPIGWCTTKNINHMRDRTDKYCDISKHSARTKSDPNSTVSRKETALSKFDVKSVNVPPKNNSCHSNDVANGIGSTRVSRPCRTNCTTPVQAKNINFQNDNSASPRSRIPVLNLNRSGESSRIPIRYSPVSKTLESPRIPFSPNSKQVNTWKWVQSNAVKQKISENQQTPISKISSYNSPKKFELTKARSITTPRTNTPSIKFNKIEVNNNNRRKIGIINGKKNILETEKLKNVRVTSSPSHSNLKTSGETRKIYSCQTIETEKTLSSRNRKEPKRNIIQLKSTLKEDEKPEKRLVNHTKSLELHLSDELESEFAIFGKKQALTLKDLIKPDSEKRVPRTKNDYKKPGLSGGRNQMLGIGGQSAKSHL